MRPLQTDEHWEYTTLIKAVSGRNTRYLSDNEQMALRRLLDRKLVTLRSQVDIEGNPNQKIILTKEGKKFFKFLNESQGRRVKM